jgi:hypothetical protein
VEVEGPAGHGLRHPTFEVQADGQWTPVSSPVRAG